MRLAAKATRFSRTERFGKMRRPSGTTAIPARPIRSGGCASIALPRKRMLPRMARVSPRIERTVVVLPMPLRPSSVTISPCSMHRSMPNRIWLAP